MANGNEIDITRNDPNFSKTKEFNLEGPIGLDKLKAINAAMQSGSDGRNWLDKLYDRGTSFLQSQWEDSPARQIWNYDFGGPDTPASQILNILDPVTDATNWTAKTAAGYPVTVMEDLLNFPERLVTPPDEYTPRFQNSFGGPSTFNNTKDSSVNVGMSGERDAAAAEELAMLKGLVDTAGINKKPAVETPPTSSELMANLISEQSEQARNIFNVETQRLVNAEITAGNLVQQLEDLKTAGITGAAKAQREALQKFEETRLARIIAQEEQTTNQLKSLEAARVEQQDRVQDKAKTRVDDMLSNYAETAAEALAKLNETGAENIGPITPAVGGNTESTLMALQGGSQQDVFDILADASDNEAINRAMKLSTMYDSAENQLSDNIFNALNTVNTEESAALQNLAEAILMGEIAQSEITAEGMNAAEDALMSTLSANELGVLQDEISMAAASEQTSALAPIISMMMGTQVDPNTLGLILNSPLADQFIKSLFKDSQDTGIDVDLAGLDLGFEGILPNAIQNLGDLKTYREIEQLG